MPFLFALLDRALPGGQVDVKEGVVVWPDGRREQFKRGHLGWSFGPGQLTWVTTLQFPDRRDDGFARPAAPAAGAVPDAACHVIVIGFLATAPDSMPPDPTVIGYREAIPDLASHTEECDAGLVAGPTVAGGSPDPSWPNVVVTFSSAHHGPLGPTFIDWRAVLDSGTMTWLSRVPVSVTRHRTGGATWEDIGRVELPSWESRFTGESSGRTLSVPCELATCKVTSEAVLRVFG